MTMGNRRAAPVASSLFVLALALFALGGTTVARAALPTPCDTHLKPGKAFPYAYDSKRGYCEGLTEEDHGSSLQLVQLMATGLIGNNLTTLVVSVPKAPNATTRNVAIKGLTLMPGLPYHFDAELASGSALTVDLEAVLKKNSVTVESLAYVATSDETTLVPLALGTKKVDSPLTWAILGVRVPANVAQLAYRVYPSDQSPPDYRNVDLGAAVNGIVKIRFDLDPSKVLRLELRGDIPGQPSQRLSRLISSQ